MNFLAFTDKDTFRDVLNLHREQNQDEFYPKVNTSEDRISEC